MAENILKNGTATIIFRVVLGVLLSGLISLSVWTVRSIAEATVQRALQKQATVTVHEHLTEIKKDCKEREVAVDAVKLYVATSSKDIEQIKKDMVEVKERLGKIEDRLPLTTASTP